MSKLVVGPLRVRVATLERQLEEAQGKLDAAEKWIGGCSCKHCPEIRRILKEKK